MTPGFLRSISSALLPPTQSSTARAAVIMLIRSSGEPALLYTRRALHLRSHPGEVCFPGGMREAGDLHLLDTALREMEEEIGLSGQHVQVLGRLPDFSTRAGISVAPFVGLVDGCHALVPCEAELDSVFWVPLASFQQGIQVQDDVFEHDGSLYQIPVYHYDNYKIWGFTAAVTASFLDLLKNPIDTVY